MQKINKRKQGQKLGCLGIEPSTSPLKTERADQLAWKMFVMDTGLGQTGTRTKLDLVRQKLMEKNIAPTGIRSVVERVTKGKTNQLGWSVCCDWEGAEH